jgi:enterochelin esterase family protein
VVGVFIENPFSVRNDELFWNPAYADFVATELVPWIRQRYNITKDPRRVVIAGASAGGAGAMYAALQHSDVFGNVLSQSAGLPSPERLQQLAERTPATDGSDRHIAEEIEDRSLTEGVWMARLFIKAPKRSIRFYMDVGTFETDFMGGGLGALEPNRHMRDVLLAKGYEVHYQEYIGGHDYIS